jgi:hypothetical protein
MSTDIVGFNWRRGLKTVGVVGGLAAVARIASVVAGPEFTIGHWMGLALTLYLLATSVRVLVPLMWGTEPLVFGAHAHAPVVWRDLLIGEVVFLAIFCIASASARGGSTHEWLRSMLGISFTVFVISGLVTRDRPRTPKLS